MQKGNGMGLGYELEKMRELSWLCGVITSVLHDGELEATQKKCPLCLEEVQELCPNRLSKAVLTDMNTQSHFQSLMSGSWCLRSAALGMKQW